MSTEKESIRETMRERLRSLDVDWIRERSQRIEAAVVSMAEFGAARTVCAYLAMSREPRTSAIVEACWSEGKRLCTPAFRSETEGYALARLSRDGLVTVGPHRAPEPRHPAWVSEAEVDVMIVPGLAFDASGGRLGRGGGHYDRILRRVRATAFRMGLGFDFQVVAQVPMLERDMRLDAVITETRVIRTPDRLNERPGERSASCTS